MNGDDAIDHEDWPLRPFLLAALGAVLGLVFHLLVRADHVYDINENPLRIAAGGAVAVGGIVFAFSLERLRWAWAAAFAALAALVAGLVTWLNGAPGGWGADEGWQLFACLLSIAIAVPLFQTLRDAGRPHFPPRAVHSHVWTNLILWGAAWAFVVATVLLSFLLAELFRLIGIEAVRKLVQKEWFVSTLIGAALGGAVGMLRDRDRVLGTLQRVVTAILSVLAPVLAFGLVAFVLALPFTGLTPLWESTKETTPILLACIAASIVLANAVIGNGAEEEARSRVLRYSAAALAAVIVPLALVAAVSTGKRIGQYGFTPDRLWAAVFVANAVAAGAAYLAALAIGRGGWPRTLRIANVRLAIGVCLLALFLALPIVSFGAISARDQVARLESGKVAPERFDWAALRFDFGPAGRRALEALAASRNPAVRDKARKALASQDQWALRETVGDPDRPSLRIPVDGGAAMPAGLEDAISRSAGCRGEPCRLIVASPTRAVLLAAGCDDCGPEVLVYEADAQGTWRRVGFPDGPPAGADPGPPLAARRVEIRKVQREQVFIDGKPVGEDF